MGPESLRRERETRVGAADDDTHPEEMAKIGRDSGSGLSGDDNLYFYEDEQNLDTYRQAPGCRWEAIRKHAYLEMDLKWDALAPVLLELRNDTILKDLVMRNYARGACHARCFYSLLPPLPPLDTVDAQHLPPWDDATGVYSIDGSL